MMKTTTNKNLEMKFSHTIGVKTLYISLLLFFTLAAGNIFAQTVIHSGVSKHPNLFGQHYERNSTDKSNLCEDFLPTNTFAVGNHQPSLPSYKKIDVAFNPLSLIHLYDSIYFWKWDTLSNGWIFNVKIINFVYDVNNNQTSSLTQLWNGSVWENNFLSTYTYDTNNNQTSSLTQGWNGSAWDNYSLDTYTYDANNNQTSYLSQYWNGSSWYNIFQYTYTYDANNFRKSSVHKFFNSIGTINYADSAYYYFHLVTTGVNDLMSQNEGILVYPNPFGNELKISGSGNGGGEVILFDVLGKEILREKISNEETIINTEKLMSGFYLLNYTNGNKAANTKVLKF